MTMTQQIQRPKKKQKHLKPVPQEFSEDCKALAVDFEKVRPKVFKIYEKWKAKHESVKDITRWLRTELKQWYSPAGITLIIPKEYHRNYKKSGKYVGFTKNGKNVPAAERPTQSLQNSNCVAQNTTTTIPQQQTKLGSTRKEPQETHIEGRLGRTNQGPDEYEITQLKNYDAEYLRDVVMWLHETKAVLVQGGFKWQVKFDEMKSKIKALELENEGLRKELKALQEKQNGHQ